MDIISSKAAITAITERLPCIYYQEGPDAFIRALHTQVLKKKVRFPILEHAGKLLYEDLPAKGHLPLLDKIIDLHEIGSNVLAGTFLQLRLEKHFKQSIDKAIEYIITGDEWYVCDIIGERVMGHGLLTQPMKTLPTLQKMAKHENKWIVRCIGVAGHYATKKGLQKAHVEEVFQLLLSLGGTTDFHTKKGIGWAAKTTAKFYPDLVSKYQLQIEETRQWFRTKVNIGLSRKKKYAHRYNSQVYTQ
jgi:3-methyladenine DNA glycosylase AlkD